MSEAISRKVDRSYLLTYSGPYFMNIRTAVGAVNMTLMPYFSTHDQKTPGSGQSGAPSRKTEVTPSTSGA